MQQTTHSIPIRTNSRKRKTINLNTKQRCITRIKCQPVQPTHKIIIVKYTRLHTEIQQTIYSVLTICATRVNEVLLGLL